MLLETLIAGSMQTRTQRQLAERLQLFCTQMLVASRSAWSKRVTDIPSAILIMSNRVLIISLVDATSATHLFLVAINATQRLRQAGSMMIVVLRTVTSCLVLIHMLTGQD